MGETTARKARPMLTGDDLVAIEVRARAVVRRSQSTHQTIAIAYSVCERDVPDLLVEIRRLRKALARAVQAAQTKDGE